MAKAPKIPAETYPTEGGSYVRSPDGKLDQVEQTKPAPPAGDPIEPPAAAPVTPKE